jgi:hypothetical protein
MAVGSGSTFVFDDGFHNVCAVFFHESTMVLVALLFLVIWGDDQSLSDDSDVELLSWSWVFCCLCSCPDVEGWFIKSEFELSGQLSSVFEITLLNGNGGIWSVSSEESVSDDEGSKKKFCSSPWSSCSWCRISCGSLQNVDFWYSVKSIVFAVSPVRMYDFSIFGNEFQNHASSLVNFWDW